MANKEKLQGGPKDPVDKPNSEQNKKNNLALYALDSLRQLAYKFLQRDELARFQF